MAAGDSLELRLDRLEARHEIAELVARYGITCDDRDLPGLCALFTPDARVTSRDGVMRAQGIEELKALYRGRFAALGPSFHFTHDRIVTFDDADPDHATGLVLSHAEVFRNGQAMWAAMRYEDDYRRQDGRWKFAHRHLTFFYYLPYVEYAEGLGDRDRMRAYGDRRPADFPETLPTWTRWKSD